MRPPWRKYVSTEVKGLLVIYHPSVNCAQGDIMVNEWEADEHGIRATGVAYIVRARWLWLEELYQFVREWWHDRG